MNEVTIGEVRPGEWVAASGANMLGRIEGDFWFGYRPVTLDGRRLGRVCSLEAAGQVLALEFVLHYGEKVGA